MKETRLKSYLFIILFLAKLAVALVVLFHFQSHGFDGKQAAAAITLVLPLFSVYTGLMFKDYVADAPQNAAPRRIGRGRATTYMALTALYGLVICLIVYMQPSGAYEFENMQTMVASAETFFGVYIGTIVFSLFKKNSDETT
jgi:uncharacterized membrane protein